MNKKLWGKTCEFIWGAQVAKDIPTFELPKVAFVGRSNVGKSTLINALTNQKSLCRVSKTPGRTQQINYFKNGETFILVDLPGYGFAQVAKAQKQKWQGLMESFFKKTKCFTFVLVDARRGLMDSDLQMMTYLKGNFAIVLTKIDKGKNIDALITEVKEKVGVDVLGASSASKKGITELQNYIEEIIKQ